MALYVVLMVLVVLVLPCAHASSLCHANVCVIRAKEIDCSGAPTTCNGELQAQGGGLCGCCSICTLTMGEGGECDTYPLITDPSHAAVFQRYMCGVGLGCNPTSRQCQQLVNCSYADGNQYVPGQRFSSTDGCNTCTCMMDGSVACTEIACPLGPPCTYADGNRYTTGQRFPSIDGCNTCTCMADGAVACTEIGCSGRCTYDDGNQYATGQRFSSIDGCNTCTCMQDGSVACTEMVCEPAVLGCNDLGLFGCTTAHGTKLTTRRGLDKIDSSRDYAKSCEYIQEWFWCIADKRDGCGDGNVNLKAYNEEYARLRETPYSCTVSGASSLMISVTSLAVMLMAAMKMA